MPKKTKREKIIAEYRRKLSTIREVIPTSLERIKDVSPPRQVDPPTYAYQAKVNASTRTIVAVQPMDQAIRRDLIKTLILAVVAIGGEVVLSMMIK